jgi:hypothetical protein
MLRPRRSSPLRGLQRLAQSGVGSGAQAAGDDDAKLAGKVARSDVGSGTKAERRKAARRRRNSSAAPA